MGELADRTIKNTAFSFIGFVWTLLLSFVAMPIVINGLGTAKYGFFVLLNTLLTVFSLLDLGIGYPFFKKLSEDPENPDYPNLSKLFSMTFWYYTAVGVLALLVLFLAKDLFYRVVNPQGNLVASYDLLFLMVGLSFLFKVVVGVFSSIPNALQRMDLIVKINLFNVTLIQLLSIVAVWQGYGVASLIFIQFICAFFVLLAYVGLWRRMLPQLRLRWYFSWVKFTRILKDGVMVFLANMMNNVIAQFDKFVLSFFWGPGAVTYYSSSQMITDKIHTTAMSLANAFTPVFSNVSHLAQNDKLASIFRRSARTIMIITFGLMTMVGSFGWEFLHYWLGGDFAQKSTPAIYFLAATYFLLSIFALIYNFLAGVRRLKFLVVTGGLIAVLDIIFMFLLIPKFSVTGAAMAYLLSALPVIGYLYLIERRIFGVARRREIVKFYGLNFLKMFSVGATVFLFSELVITPLVTNLWLVILFGALGYLLYIGLYKIFGFFEKEDWELFIGFFRKIFNKLLNKNI